MHSIPLTVGQVPFGLQSTVSPEAPTTSPKYDWVLKNKTRLAVDMVKS